MNVKINHDSQKGINLVSENKDKNKEKQIKVIIKTTELCMQ